LIEASNILTAVVRNAVSGDANSQEQLYRQFGKAMYNVCLRMTGSSADAEDLLQESFIHAFQNLHQLRNELQFGGWLKRIVVNACIKHCKKNMYLANWDDVIEKADEQDDSGWWQHISLEKIHRTIQQLPNGCREVFNLFVMEDYSHQDIAETLKISVSTSKSQYHRARMLLREQLNQQIEAHG
jgi:RNA polymerase sigma factor (sigma-70 family)